MNDHENNGLFYCVREFYADKLLPLSFLELLLFGLFKVRNGHVEVCVSWRTWASSLLSLLVDLGTTKFIDSKSLKNGYTWHQFLLSLKALLMNLAQQEQASG